MSDRQDCDERREAVAALVMGALEAQLAEELRRHLGTCETCQQVYRALADEERLVRGAFEELARDANAVALSVLEGGAERSARSGGRVVRALRGIVEGVRTTRLASRIVVAAAIVVLIVVLLSWRTPSGRGPGLAFADVMQKLQKVRAASFTVTTRCEGPRLPGFFPPMERVMEILGRKARMETSTGETYIFDFEARRMVCLHQPSMLMSEYETGARSILPGSSLEEVKQKLVAKEGKEEELGEQLVEGKRATGFRIERTDGVWTVWADARTGLLVRIDSVTQTPTGRVERIWKDFKFDVEFDDALFDLQPPAGYKVVDARALPLRPGQEPDLSPSSLCRGNLKQIGIAVFMYLQAHHQYPNSLDDLVTYLEGRQALVCPGSREEGYVYEKPATPFMKVVEPQSVMTVYDKPGNHEGGRNVLFLDGHVQWMTEGEFQKAHSDPSHH
jgi:prepilin-type processing-associated H-X9-DG protein